MQDLRSIGAGGAILQARGDRWRVVRVRPFDSCALVTLEGWGVENRGRQITLVAPFDRLCAASPALLARRPRGRVVRGLVAAAARQRPPGGCWTAASGRFDLLPWQLEPALSVLGGATRLLLADGVGLGKTIQAGLILAELLARGLVERALVLTPASLRAAWAAELAVRFGLDARVLDQAALLDDLREGPAGANPWARPVVVSSIDLVKRAEVRAAVEDEAIDLLVVDEAHHLTPATDRGDLVARLARRVPWVVLVSATPHTGDPRLFRTLLEIGRASRAEPGMRLFRRQAHEVAGPRAPARRTHVLPVVPGRAERSLHAALLAYARDILAGPGRNQPGAALVAALLVRRAVSSPVAAGRTLERRLAAVAGGTDSAAGETQAALPWEETEDDDGEERRWLRWPALGDPREERRRLRTLISHAREASAAPSKLRRLGRLLAKVREPVIVFTEFRDTLEACLPFVPRDEPVACLHGGLDVADRHHALQSFLDGRARVLLATDVAGEGLNLQSRARLVVTVEWPWNPQRLEQRIGRVDRLGQARRVHAVHLTARGTFEDTVVARLLGRAARASRDLESQVRGADVERAIAARVLGAAAQGQALHRYPSGGVPVAGAALEALRLADVRRLAQVEHTAAIVAAWAPPRRGTRPGRAAAVFEVARRTPAGRLTGSALVAIEVELTRRPESHAQWKHVARGLGADPRVWTAAVEAASRGGGETWPAAAARIDAIRRALTDATPAPLQASLFDTRAIRAAEARREVVARLDAHLARLASLVDGTGAPAADATLLAVLPLSSRRPG